MGIVIGERLMAQPPGERLSYLFTIDQKWNTSPAELAAEFLLWIPGLFWIWLILPRRRTNAFYLRSFRNDEQTWPIRQAIQDTLGRCYRLSGIRDPRRRLPRVFRYMLAALFAFRYSTSKFMNLEAGEEWKARLWRSLGDARCAFIDVSDPTQFVEEEIELCQSCLGLGRILFIGHAESSVSVLRRHVEKALCWNVDCEKIQVVIWEDTPAGRQAFVRAVEQFAKGLPSGTAGLCDDALPLINFSSMPGEGRPAREGRGCLELLLGTILGWLAFGLMTINPVWVKRGFDGPWDEAAVVAPVISNLVVVFALDAVVFVFFIGYFRDLGSSRERIWAAATFVTCLAASVSLYVYMLPIRKERALAPFHKMQSRENLRAIGSAFWEHYDAKGCFPSIALTDRNSHPVLSWRVQLLPYLGEKELYRAFRLDEPWDGPNNHKLLERMPRFYAAWGRDKDTARGLTYYKVFDGPGTALNRFSGARFTDFADGLSNTILVIEAADPVPWTCPEDIPFGPRSRAEEEVLLSRLGFRSGWVHVVLADRTVFSIDRSIAPFKLRALITRSGEEPVDPWD